MSDQKLTTRLGPNGSSLPLQPNPASPAAPLASRYQHILVPLTGAAGDREALILAAEFAGLHLASLTLLSIAPAASDAASVHWLGAIDRLHQTLDKNAQRSPNDASHAASLQAKLEEFFQSEVPQSLRAGLTVSMEVQTGEFADTVARYAEASAADLVIMSCGQPRWGRPVLSGPVRRTMQLTRQPVILVRPDVSDRKRSTAPVNR